MEILTKIIEKWIDRKRNPLKLMKTMRETKEVEGSYQKATCAQANTSQQKTMRNQRKSKYKTKKTKGSQ